MSSLDVAGPSRKNARITGVLYLLSVLTGMFALAYVPSKIPLGGDAAQSISHILGNQALYRQGIVAGALCYLSFLLLPLAFYRLLHRVNTPAAILMVVFALTSVPIAFIALQHQLDILSLLRGADYLKALTPQELDAEVMFAVDGYRNAILLSEIFWGLWLFPLGYLIVRSGFLPKILGVLLMLGCLGYLIQAFGSILSPAFTHTAWSDYVLLPASLGEIGTCLWLLLFGIREKALASVAAAVA